MLRVLFLAVWFSILIFVVWLWFFNKITIPSKLQRRVNTLSLLLFIFAMLWFISLELQRKLLSIYLCIALSPLVFITTFLITLPILIDCLMKLICLPGYIIVIWIPMFLYEHVDNTIFLSITLVCLYKFMWYHFSYPGIRYSRLPMLIKTLNRVIMFLSINEFSVRFATCILFLFYLFVVFVYDIYVNPRNVRDISEDIPWLSVFGAQCVVTAIIFLIWWTIHAPGFVFEFLEFPFDEDSDDSSGE